MNNLDLSQLGKLELDSLQKVIKAYIDYPLPSRFVNIEVKAKIGIDKEVYLRNWDGQMLVLDADEKKLEMYYFLPYSGIEGLKHEIEEQLEELEAEDLEYYNDFIK